jgi:hypothetical protein
MEEETNVDIEGTVTEETTPKTTDEETTEDSGDSTEESQDIDYEKELEALERPTRTELEKAQRALHFNAERLKELGGDPADVLKIKPVAKKEDVPDIDAKFERKFAERDAQALARNEAEFKLIMWYVDNKNLSIDEAHLLANKGRILRAADEAKRGNVQYGQPVNSKKVVVDTTPDRSPEEKAVLQRRGLSFNPKTKTWQGKYSEEYYDKDQRRWVSRKLTR